MITAHALSRLYRAAHNAMRNLDGLQPHEAFDELLKYLFLQQHPPGRGTRLPRSPAQLAAQLRSRFAGALAKAHGAASVLWADRKLRLSDAALLALHEQLADHPLAAAELDVRAAALRQFLGPELRRGLGIFLTPDEVARAVVEAAAPARSAVVYDPACGSGTFLLETLRYWRASPPDTAPLRVRASDISERMLLLAELALGHSPGVELEHRVLDALAPRAPAWPAAGTVEVILTNPPFGVHLKAPAGRRAPSEVVFLERCLRWLRPGGLLAAVVPRSVVTNRSLAAARRALDAAATLVGVLGLPPETFSITGTNTNTIVLFLRKRRPRERTSGTITVPVIEISNVGHDSTGRARQGSQLERAGRDLRASMQSGGAEGLAHPVVLPRATPLSNLAGARAGRAPRAATQGTRRLGDVLELAQTGRTPARAAYTTRGTFTVKVGNLTGQGLDWAPRERNFVDPARVSASLLLREGDLVLTSSAHNPKYIAQKVDIVHAIPGERATFVAEVMRLRVRPGTVSPYELLAFLRTPATRAAIVGLVRGQTAHLRPSDLLTLPLPETLASPELVELLQREAALAHQLNLVTARQRELFELASADEADEA